MTHTSFLSTFFLLISMVCYTQSSVKDYSYPANPTTTIISTNKLLQKNLSKIESNSKAILDKHIALKENMNYYLYYESCTYSKQYLNEMAKSSQLIKSYLTKKGINSFPVYNAKPTPSSSLLFDEKIIATEMDVQNTILKSSMIKFLNKSEDCNIKIHEIENLRISNQKLEAQINKIK